MASDETGLGFNDMLNTEKALSVILGIFLSVAIAFVFGTVVQFLTRTIFSFNYKRWTLWMLVIALINVVIMLFTRKKYEDDEDENTQVA